MSTSEAAAPIRDGRELRSPHDAAPQGTAPASLQTYARVAGALYLVVIVGGIFAEFFVRSAALVPGDPAETASNVLGSQTLFRVAFAADLLVVSCDVALALLFFVLLRPVSENLALLAAFFRLTQAAILGVNALLHIAVLLVLTEATYLTVLGGDQQDAVALALLEAHQYGYDIALVFFGISLFLLGYLVYRSGYLPKILGVLLVAASFGYVIDSLVSALVPSLDEEIAYVLVPAFVAEIALCLWLLIRGVNGSGRASKAPG